MKMMMTILKGGLMREELSERQLEELEARVEPIRLLLIRVSTV